MDDMNNLGSRELKAIDDMNDSASWTQAFRCYEQLKIVDDMDESGS